MTDALLRERHMLVVEDGFLLASELCRAWNKQAQPSSGLFPIFPPCWI